jgi:polysaccharide biosynthesis/export protein
MELKDGATENLRLKIRFWKQILIFLLMMGFTLSCVSSKKLSYFNDINSLEEPFVNPRVQKVIMPFDNLYIKVLSIDEQTNQIFNANEGGGGAQFIITYPVDEKGNINFPFVGDINVGGLNVIQASTKIQSALNAYVSKTSIVVRYINNEVTIIGQVQNQGIHPFSKDKLNVYEALSLAGGISEFGNRKSVILIRQEGDKIMHHKLNLSDSKIAGKDYYYVIPNDILVVEPLKSASWFKFTNATYSTILTSITTFLAIYVLFFANGQ